MEQDDYRPWYRDQTHTQCPFQLVKNISPHNTNRTPSPDFRTLATFPWTSDSLSTLWKGALNTEEFIPNWQKMVAEYWDAVAVGSDLGLYVFFSQKRRKRPLCVRLPTDDQELIEADVMSVAWSLSHNAPFEPVIIFSRGSVAYIYSIVREGMAGYIRGHGGTITSIAVHPTTTHLFSTTSRDHSTRIYDLNLLVLSSSKSKSKKRQTTTKEEKIFNPHWPPSMGAMSFAGAPHGLHLRPSEKEDEGNGLGRCIAVLMGGRSGGHNAAVLGAAFHPIYPIIATCGMDRCVKIWAVRPTSPVEIKREDKPLFSSSRIHKARVLSVAWLQDDLLLTHSAPAIMRRYPNDSNNKECYLEPGELIVWRWLGVDRFFPPRYEETPQSVLRGCSSDYQESASFMLVSIHRFPAVPDQYTVPLLNLFQTPTHDPVVTLVYPGKRDGDGGGEFLMVNLVHLEPKRKPVFPLDFGKAKGKTREASGTPTTKRRTKKGKRMRALVDAAQGLSIVQDAVGEGGGVDEVDDGNIYAEDPDTDEGSSSDEGINKTPLLNGREEIDPPGLKGWKIGIWDEEEFEPKRRKPRLMNCALGMGGKVIVGVGSGSSLWVWKLNFGFEKVGPGEEVGVGHSISK